MSSSIKVIFRKTSKDGALGYLFLQRVENRKSSVRSLKLPPLDIKYWDKVKQRVKKSTKIDFKGYNDTIEQRLSVVLADGRSFKTYDGANSKASFLAFYQMYLDSAKLRDKTGTRIKYNTVYQKLKKYLKSKGKDDLLFTELTHNTLDDFRHYMRQNGMEHNTAIHYLKILQAIYGHAQKDKDMIVGNNPFNTYAFGRKQPKLKESLTKDDFNTLIRLQFDKPRISKVRDLFLFQFFTGGMRSSDLVTLRYNNLSDGRISYRMFKTGTVVNVVITDAILKVMMRLIGLKVDVNTPVQSQKDIYELKQMRRELLLSKTYGVMQASPYGLPKNVVESVPLAVVVDKTYWVDWSQVITSMTMDELVEEESRLSNFQDSKGRIKYSGFEFNYSDMLINNELFYKSFHAQVVSRITELKKTYHDNSIGVLNGLAKDKVTSTKFVFGMLKNSDFSDVNYKNDFSFITEEQYNKVTKAGIVYNRNLKELQRLTGINKTFSTHLPRTSFANIMMSSGATTMDVSKALGHSSLSVTDEYLKTGFDDGRTDTVLKTLGDQFDL